MAVGPLALPGTGGRWSSSGMSGPAEPAMTVDLPLLRSALVVIAHPDDESFGLGGVLARLATEGARLRVLCFTRGEASTLGAAADLAVARPQELADAAEVLSVTEVSLLDYPDGSLAEIPGGELERVVDAHLGDVDAVVVFEPHGVTGHPDNQAATRAAERVAARRGLPVLEWGVRRDVAEVLNAEFGTTFVAFDGDDVAVDREAQWRAIRCHRTQSYDNPVLHRRLQLQGELDRVRLMH